ncbi:MAG: HD domain-containing protein [Anaerolineae bacterium]
MANLLSSPTELYPFTPTADVLWEPVWNLRVSLTPCEQELLNSRPLQRLGFVHTFGAGGLTMPTSHSRLSHVRGVFALTAYFRPDDEALRLAALLHDVGHGPFSHSSEVLPGFDHHQAGREIISGETVGEILRRHGFEPDQIVALANGQPPNPVRTENGLLHLDHLDFFVRDPLACGWHTPTPAEILDRLRLDGPNVAADLATAEHLVERILFEHRLFTAPVKVAAEAVLGQLLRMAGEKGYLSAGGLSIATLTDADLLAQLRQTGDLDIKALLERLLYGLQECVVRRLEPGETPPPGALVAHFDKPYLGQPLVEGRPVSDVSRRAASMLAEARALMGTFVVQA